MPNTQITQESLPLPWEAAVEHVEKVKEKAAKQFLAIWRDNKDREDPEQRWGEEIEYMLVDLADGAARAALCADQVLRLLGPETGSGLDPTATAGWRTEYGNMMVEGVTLPPFTWSLEDVLLIEPALKWRRRELERVVAEVAPSARVVTLAAFPLLGVEGCTSPAAKPAPDGEVSGSVMCPDEATSPHPRYKTFTANYRKRKGCKVGALVPREDIRPEQRLSAEAMQRVPFELAGAGSRDRDPVEGHIYMDSQAFGACQCCTQATFLARNLDEARYLADQFLVLAPLFLALTAATPFARGCVADTDTRWGLFQQSWDDRREEELDSVRNSRVSANDLFIGSDLLDDDAREGRLNDVDLPVHRPTVAALQEAGLDRLLSQHVAHIVVRDPLCVFENQLDLDDSRQADHWEQLQGTSWGSVRFKPPPCAASAAAPGGQNLGWRVEFRTPEVQLTDFENAAIVAVLRLLVQVIIEEHLDFRLPVSLCDANDAASNQREAATKALFWFRSSDGNGHSEVKGPPQQRLLREILSGPDGIFTSCRAWLDRQHQEGRCSAEARAALQRSLALFDARARGELPTPATLLRAMLKRHPEYRDDALLPLAFVKDLCEFAAAVNLPGSEWPTELLGPPPTDS